MINCWSYIPIKYPMSCHTDWFAFPHFPMFEIDEVATTWAGCFDGRYQFRIRAVTNAGGVGGNLGDAVPLQW